jgi:hypothetical protein
VYVLKIQKVLVRLLVFLGKSLSSVDTISDYTASSNKVGFRNSQPTVEIKFRHVPS